MDKNARQERHDRTMWLGYSIPGWLWPREQGWLFHAFIHSGSHVEIGAYCGKSLLVSCMGMVKPCRVLAVDSMIQCDMGVDWNQAVLDATIEEIHRRTRCKVDFAKMSSIEAYRQAAARGDQFDSVFIDGDHNYAECKIDIESWSTLVRPGGLVSGHDYWPRDEGVMDAVNETGPFEVVPDTRIWYRRV